MSGVINKYHNNFYWYFDEHINMICYSKILKLSYSKVLKNYRYINK